MGNSFEHSRKAAALRVSKPSRTQGLPASMSQIRLEPGALQISNPFSSLDSMLALQRES